jgi:hypothetical protein
VKRIKELIPIVEKRADINVINYLGKQPLTSPLKTKTDKWDKYYGELDESGAFGVKHGRGINIRYTGDITIGYWKYNFPSTGNYISINSSGMFEVGEIFWKKEGRWARGTWYYTIGTGIQYDRPN